MLNLTPDNYYTVEADREYMSVTQFKSFRKCEAATMARLNGEWEPDGDKTALLVGNYLHSHFESETAHQAFVEAHSDRILNKRTHQPYKAFSDADGMIATLDNDEMFGKLYRGDKEAIVIGNIAGVEWMGKLDCLAPNRKFFIDLKTTKSIKEAIWTGSQRDPFVYAYGYDLQMAVYQELCRQQYGIRPDPMIIAVSKQTPPDKAAITISQDRLDMALGEVLDLQPVYQAVKTGKRAPIRCEECDYCRATKQLSRIGTIDADELIY